MRVGWFSAVLIGLVVTMPYRASAVNCDQVRRYLSTGRSAEDVADTMIISIDDVKKCQQADEGDKKAPKPDSKPEQPEPKQ